ncbi:hypothetical protein [Methanohalophilus sp.]|uniref:hypothetical protein n=1 Tax=Methanohalophilus sp. TaxID=1966352 RepID=UPI002622DC66|nr:hypothetical protein [Methanohalophilus sp.]MDK2892434.1 hypothetical protein [Methanohalophilus sp.]
MFLGIGEYAEVAPLTAQAVAEEIGLKSHMVCCREKMLIMAFDLELKDALVETKILVRMTTLQVWFGVLRKGGENITIS